MIYFYNTTQIMFGIASPIIAVYMLYMIVDSISAYSNMLKNINLEKLLLNASNWHFKGKADCVNKEYIRLTFMNDKTNQRLGLSVKKKDLGL